MPVLVQSGVCGGLLVCVFTHIDFKRYHEPLPRLGEVLRGVVDAGQDRRGYPPPCA
ncbi:MAG: hypothetical protein ABW176_08885 [Candidatus Thiodiazotropha endolucinida]